MRIKDLPKVNRPREKLIKYGPKKLTTTELLAILLGSGKKNENVLEIAKKVLRTVNFDQEADINQLIKISGIGKTKACQILASIEFVKRIFKNRSSLIVTNPKDIFKQLYDIKDNKKEYFIAFYLDARNLIIKREIVSIGILNASLVHPREIFEPAIKNLSAQIIIAHNHPSGDCQPSEEDILLTKRLIEAGKILDIKIIDHIIVSKDNYFSFRENKLIKDE